MNLTGMLHMHAYDSWYSWFEPISYVAPVLFEHVKERKWCKSLLSPVYFLNGCFDVATFKRRTLTWKLHTMRRMCMQWCCIVHRGRTSIFIPFVHLSSRKRALFCLQVVCYHPLPCFEFMKCTYFRRLIFFFFACWLCFVFMNVLINAHL